MANNHNTDDKEHKMSRSEAARKAGETVAKEKGPEFYSEIGKQQGKENNPGNFANRSKEDVAAAGREGGKASGHARAEHDDLEEAA